MYGRVRKITNWDLRSETVKQHSIHALIDWKTVSVPNWLSQWLLLRDNKMVDWCTSPLTKHEAAILKLIIQCSQYTVHSQNQWLDAAK